MDRRRLGRRNRGARRGRRTPATARRAGLGPGRCGPRRRRGRVRRSAARPGGGAPPAQPGSASGPAVRCARAARGLSRRPPAAFHRRGRGRPRSTLGAVSGHLEGAAARRHGARALPVLVSRRPHDRLLSEREAAANRRRRRTRSRRSPRRADRVSAGPGTRTARSCSARPSARRSCGFRPPAELRSPRPTLDAKRGDAAHLFPSFLPDGRRFTFAARNVDPRKSSVALGDLDAGASAGRVLFQSDSSAVWGPPGYLLFAREGTLFAQRFDAAARGPGGRPRRCDGEHPVLDRRESGGSVGRRRPAGLRPLAARPPPRLGGSPGPRDGHARTRRRLRGRPDFSRGRSGRRVHSKSGGELESRRLGRRRRPRRRLPGLDRAVRRVSSRLDSRRPEADLCVGSRRLLRSLREARRRRAGDRGDPDGLGQAGQRGHPGRREPGLRRVDVGRERGCLAHGSGRGPDSEARHRDEGVRGGLLAAFAGRPMDRLHVRRVRAARSLRGAVSVGAQAAGLERRRRRPGLEPGRKGDLLRRPRRPPLRGHGESRRRESGDRRAAAALRPGSGPGRPVRSGASTTWVPTGASSSCGAWANRRPTRSWSTSTGRRGSKHAGEGKGSQ